MGGPLNLITDLLWPTHQQIEKLYKQDQLSRMCHHMAVRLLRQIIDQNSAQLTFDYSRQKSILVFCGPSENEELGAQMAVDVLEASGFEVRFGGGGVAADEIMGRVNEDAPSILLMFCSAPQDLPEIRGMIDQLREIGAANGTQIAVGGGVFNRAEGLAEEIGADLWACSPMEMAQTLIEEPEPPRRAEPAARSGPQPEKGQGGLSRRRRGSRAREGLRRTNYQGPDGERPGLVASRVDDLARASVSATGIGSDREPPDRNGLGVMRRWSDMCQSARLHRFERAEKGRCERQHPLERVALRVQNHNCQG